MTTRSEIKRWVRPLLDRRQDLVLEQDLLLVSPVQHILRGVCYWRGGSKHIPQVLWFMQPLFRSPSPTRGLRLTGHIPVGSSLKPDFQAVMEHRVGEAIEKYVGPIDTIEKLRDYATVRRPPHLGGFSALPLDGYPLDYAPVLAALGRLDEAQSILRPALAADEQYVAAVLQRGEARLAKRPNSVSGRQDLALVGYFSPIHAALRRLLAMVESRDRAAIAALLHEWERQNVAKWGVEHLWEATPFPVEA